MVVNIIDFKYVNVVSLPHDVLKICMNNSSNFLSKNGKKILLTDSDFVEHLNKDYLYKLEKRVQTFTLKYWLDKKYKRNRTEIYFELPICINKNIAETAWNQILNIYEDIGYFDFENWEEYLDYQVKIVALICSWGDYTKSNFIGFPKEKIEEELYKMKHKNYDIGTVKQIMEQE